MEKIAKKIDGFLKTKNIEWYDQGMYDAPEMMFRKAEDEDFDGKHFVKLSLLSQKGNYCHKNLMVTDTLFLMFDEKLKEMQRDWSKDWQEYQKQLSIDKKLDSVDAEVEERLNNFREYLKEDINE